MNAVRGTETECIDTQGHPVPKYCCNRLRSGCIGKVAVEMIKFRSPAEVAKGKDGVLVERLGYVCNKCGQAHGLVPTEKMEK